MPQPEREPTEIQTTPSEQYDDEVRKGRHRLLGEQAAQQFTILPEIETANEMARIYLESRVIGQDEVIKSIVNALDRAGVRSYKDMRPVATFAFLGPTGTGKTETATALSEHLAHYEPNLISIKCATYSHGHEVASLTGSPPGYVGRSQKPILNAEAVEQPGTVILFDEIEKGAVELHNLLLHICDVGKLTLNDGKVVSFRDAIIIMTSNLGAREMLRETGNVSRTGFATTSQTVADRGVVESAALKGFTDFFSPEFVGRTETVVFHPLEEESLHKVLDVKIADLNRDYVDDFGAKIQLSPMVRSSLVEKALARRSKGVRSLVEALDKDVTSMFGRYLANDLIDEGTEVHVFHRDELEDQVPPSYTQQLVFTTQPNIKIKRRVPPVYDFNPTFKPVATEQAIDLQDLPMSD